jgi:phosphoglycerate dehydrogenase-like enzyme
MPNVLLSPHTRSLDTAGDRLIAELFARNAASLIDGRPLTNRNPTSRSSIETGMLGWALQRALQKGPRG